MFYKVTRRLQSIEHLLWQNSATTAPNSDGSSIDDFDVHSHESVPDW